jgi:DNA-binding MarR family transcriptional regulator
MSGLFCEEVIMDNLTPKEIDILRFIRTQRHKTTVNEIARGLNFSPQEVEVFVSGMMKQDLIKVVQGQKPSEDGYYTNPEKREKIYELLG